WHVARRGFDDRLGALLRRRRLATLDLPRRWGFRLLRRRLGRGRGLLLPDLFQLGGRLLGEVDDGIRVLFRDAQQLRQFGGLLKRQVVVREEPFGDEGLDQLVGHAG